MENPTVYRATPKPLMENPNTLEASKKKKKIIVGIILGILGCILIPTTISNNNNKGFCGVDSVSRIFPNTKASLDNSSIPIGYMRDWFGINNTFHDI